MLRATIFYLLSVLAIALVLVVGNFLLDGIRGAMSARDRLGAVAAVQEEVLRYREARAARLVEELGAARRLPLAAVDARIRAVTGELQAAVPEGEADLLQLLQAGPGEYAGQLASRYKGRLDRQLLVQELGYLQQLRAQLIAIDSRAAAARELQRLHERHRAVYDRLLRKRQEVAALGWIDARRMHYPWARSPALDTLASDLAALAAENSRAAAAWRAQEAALRRMQSVRASAAFAIDQAPLDATMAQLEKQVAAARDAVSRDPLSRLAAPLFRALPLACAILVLCIAGKAAIRAFFYFVLAPLATRGGAVRLDGKAAAGGTSLHTPVELVSASAVSQALALAPHEELLVLPSHLQSAPVGAARATRWLIKGHWWASLVSGMSLLTAVRTGSRDEAVVLSASDDGLSEIALLRIPAGAGLAIQPRALVGIVCEREAPPAIGWHWRLANLHAWLTMQLRFFVIRGPVTLALQGRRGVRVQAAQGTQAIRQGATLGFSTDVAYSTVRSAPFLPYLRGRAPLLYDRFGGGRGIYVYDETPGAADSRGRARRGLEGITDALLKLAGY